MTEQFEHGYALLVGVDDHSNPSMALPTVGKDVTALYQLLTNEERCGYREENVKLIRGSEATKEGINAGLLWLTRQVKNDPDATVIIYYSGHGDNPNDGQYFLVPYDANDRLMLPIQGISAQSFAETISFIDPPRLLVVLDCCYAAGINVKEAAFPINPAEQEKGMLNTQKTIDFSPLQTGGGRYILNSSTGRETSLIRSDDKMSVFTYHLIDALNGKGRTQDENTVLVTDVIQHVARAVPETAAQHNNHSQTPYIRSEGTGFALALLQGGKGLPKGVDAPAPLEDPVVQAATSTMVQAGERGVAAGGDMSGNTIITGDNNRTDQSSSVFNQSGQNVHGNQNNVAGNVNTGGGAFIGGSVSAGGDFVGRDKIIGGDEVHGDKFTGDKVSGGKFGGDQINVGGISGSSGIAIGRGASAHVTQGMSDQQAVQIAQVFQPIYQLIESSTHPAPIQDVLKAQIRLVETEAGASAQADRQKISDALTVVKGVAPDIHKMAIDRIGISNLVIAGLVQTML